MEEIESLVTSEFYSKNKTLFLSKLKLMLGNPNISKSRTWPLDSVERSIGFNFSDKELDLSLSSVLVDGIYLNYSLYQDLKENCVLTTRNLIAKKYILPSMVLERTDSEFIKAVGVSDVGAFDKKYIRANTAYLYTQSKFNLLREESQGFSKLLVLLSENAGIPSIDNLYQGSKGKLQDLREIRAKIVQEEAVRVLDQILRLIGTFELDSNRVLDLVLDVFAAKVINYDFFIQLLRISPWNKKLYAHFMGFKYSSYCSESGNTSRPPLQMVFVSALLIKENLMDLGDIYPHLYPSEEETDINFKEYKGFCKEMGVKAARYQGPGLSGVLGDDSSKVVQVKEETKDSAFDKIDFKADLVECLLALGDLGNARKLLARSPNMSSMYPGIAEAACRLLHVIIQPIYQPLEPLPRREINLDSYPPSLPSLNFRTSERPYIGKKISNSKYSFFYHSWAENLITVSDYPSAVRILRVILSIIGGHLSKDVNLVYKVIRIGKAHIESAKYDPKVMNSWLNIISQNIFPAVSLTYSNPGLTCELWSFLKLFPYTTRYGLYGEWKSLLYRKIPEMSTALIGCEKDTKYIMARLSKETIKQYGRHIGKTVHSNPTVSFAYIIKQLESYDNMIVHVVDASRYLTDIELDILAFSLIDALSDRRKKRVEQNGTSFAPWLKSLANFCGTLFRRHSVDLGGVLRYIYNQLAVDNPYDLLVLQEMITSMSGIRIAEDVTNEQIEATGAGETLRRESLMFESARSSAKSTKRLLDSLMNSGLIVPIGILMANLKRDVICTADTHELKVIGWLHDHCKRSLLQYFDYLSSNLTLEKYSELFPSFSDIFSSTELDLGTIFHMLRPKLNFLINPYQNMETESCSLKNPDNENSMDIDHSKDVENYIESPGLQDLKAEILKSLPSSTWRYITVEFFISFWQLSLYDISVPRSLYQLEIDKQNVIIANLNADKSDMSKAAISKRSREKDRASSIIHSLKEELKAQEVNYGKIAVRIDSEKNRWFKNEISAEVSLNLLQDFIYQRCLISPYDATFCALFLFLMHSIKVPRFSIMCTLSSLFKPEITQAITFSSTENESKNFGYFMSFVMKYLILYYKDEKEFETFKSKLSKCDEMDYEEFCSKILTWENDIRSAFLYALHSGEYMQTRNSILVLDKINDFFPITKESGKKIESMIKQLEKKEKRGDLKQLCRAYYGKLQLRKKEWIEGPMEDEKSAISEDKMEDVEASHTSVENLETIKFPEDGIAVAAEDIVLTIEKADADDLVEDNTRAEDIVQEKANGLIAHEDSKNGPDVDKLEEEGEQNEEDGTNEDNSGLITEEIELKVRKSSVEEGESMISSREDGEALITPVREEGEADPETSGNEILVKERVELETVDELALPNALPDAPPNPEDQNLDKMEELRKVLRERVEASRRIQDKPEKSSKDDRISIESPSKIARNKEVASNYQNNQQNGDFRSTRSSREREDQREYVRDRSPKDSQKYTKDNRNRDSNRSVAVKSYPSDRDNNNMDSAYHSDRNKYTDYHPREYDKTRFIKDYQGRERENDRDRREYRGRSPDHRREPYISRQNLSQRNVKDVITGAMLENMKKEKFRFDEGRRYDNKEPQTKKDVYFPPAPKEDIKARDEPFRPRRDRDFSDRKDREPERSSRRSSPQRGERTSEVRISKRDKSLERSWSNDRRRDIDSRQNNYQGRKDVYTPPDPYDTKSRDKRNRVLSYGNSETVRRPDSRSKREEIHTDEKSIHKKRGLEGALPASFIQESDSQSRADSDKTSKKIKINRVMRD